MGIKRTVAKTYLKLSRWHLVVEQRPPASGSVMLGAPHTSNLDALLMLAIAWSSGFEIKWIGKKSLFRWPLGPLLRALGGIEVDRSNPTGFVEDMADELKRKGRNARAGAESPAWALVVTPEGTRSRTEYWKSGFYRIALAADLPLVLGFVDRRTRTTGLGPTIHLTGDPSLDMNIIRDFYADKQGIRPGKEGRIRLKME